MGPRRTRIKSRPEGGPSRRGSLALLRRARKDELGVPPAELVRPPAADEPAQRRRLRPEPGEFSDERRVREAGGPEDKALYACACGYTWQAPVSASVACPNCGTAQAW